MRILTAVTKNRAQSGMPLVAPQTCKTKQPRLAVTTRRGCERNALSVLEEQGEVEDPPLAPPCEGGEMSYLSVELQTLAGGDFEFLFNQLAVAVHA